MSCPVATSERLFIFNCTPSQARGKCRYRGQPGERLTRGGAMNHQARSSLTTTLNRGPTVRGRAGYAWDRVLFYGTGGAAFANVQAGAGALPFSSSTQTGWTAGAGVEYAFAPNWTAKVEYLFVDLQNASCPVGSCGSTTTTVSLNENIIRGGVNFKFGGPGGFGFGW
jgi:outer membrane immunogenic protein